MSQAGPTPTDPRQQVSLAAEQKRTDQSLKAVGRLIDRIAPSLVEFGSWIFGGLIAFTLLVIAALLTIGPVDPAIMIATTVFALALPLNVAGLFLLRLAQDLTHMRIEEEVTQAFQEIGLTAGGQIPTPETLALLPGRRTKIILSSCLGILVLSALLTLAGMIATLWHMAWWLGVAFFAMAIISLGIVIVVTAISEIPESAEQKERKRRYREEILRQAKTQKKD